MNGTSPEVPPGTLIFILALILLSGILFLAESALGASRKSRLRAKAEEGDRRCRKALEAVENPGPFRLSLRIWMAFLGILAGVLGGLGIARPLGAFLTAPGPLGPLGDGAAVFVITAALTLGLIILGFLLPRHLALLAPEKISVALLPLIRFLSFLSAPFIALSAGLGALIRALSLPSEGRAGPGMTADELRIALMEGEKSGIVESQERTMVEGVFYLGDRPVGTFMTHRSEIIWLDIKAGAEEAGRIAREFRSQGCFPVAEGNLDNVMGMVYAQDIFLTLTEEPWRGLKAILTAPRFVPETMTALKAFEAFKEGNGDFIFVMDEYGGFSGILSVRDLVEEIVGELSVPADAGGGIQEQEDGSYLAAGSVNIDNVAELLSLTSLTGEHQEYHTLAGFILNLAEEIPRIGASFDWKGFRFTIISMDGNRIERVLISPL
ncbi:MAG: hemolysin family protein [Spirochaetaceae bacterium]|jgi:putative hemolysin|nr:hemolysin family protein [Spirochaetaceae bacterium]